MKILVIGGVAGGMSAAARARRLGEDSKIIVFERGNHVSFANCGLPYHIGGEIKKREALLLQTPESLQKILNLDVRTNQEVVKIDRIAKKITVKDLKENRQYDEIYDKLVLCPGAVPIKPKLPGIEHEKIFLLRNVDDMDKIKAVIDNGTAKSAVVIGGGYIGIEMAENLILRGLKVHVVEMLNQILPPFDFEMAKDLQNHLTANGVNLHLGTAAAAFRDISGRISVELQNSEVLEADFVILSVGVRPDSELAKNAGLKLNERGGIVVNECMQTSDPDIYAAGDAVEVADAVTGQASQIPLAGPANRQGRIVADNIFGKKSSYKSTLGTAILKVFQMTGGCTGASERILKRNNIPFSKVYLHPSNHAGYYPGSTPIHFKLIFANSDGKILGAQAIGFDGIDKRIDVVATAIKAGMTVYDLEDLELSYAPPYGSAKDAVNMAGFVASNLLRGDTECWYPEDFPSKTDKGLIVDVRPEDMFNLWHIPGAVNIPHGKLRKELDKLPKDKDIYLYCKVGFTSYLAYRLLKQKGFGYNNILKTLSGGIMTFCCYHGPGICSSERNVPFVPYSSEHVNSEKFTPATATEKVSNQEVILDACGLQCPGPIMKTKTAMDNLSTGDDLIVYASDPGFINDIKSWCMQNNHQLLGISGKIPKIEARIKKGNLTELRNSQTSVPRETNKTIVVFSGDLDKVLASFVIANGALAMGSKVTMFFTFWGINVLRKGEAQAPGKGLMDKMFGMMMPNGAKKLKLSKMNMLGIGTEMMKMVMKNKKVDDLPTLIESARKEGVKLVVCSMSMDIMGIKQEELIDGLEIGGVATFLQEADKSSATLFI
ncbi:MAG: FAD-dependent oxidoreductase [Victivallales bacterium]|jgi:NADPH-dependent 2,4-dienoyl-CoA reductase/sulfur reductase-like enzyme/peroxiredoxin family protein/TusA-related sulfurtransferase/rhodanese-related sulfurtransferase